MTYLDKDKNLSGILILITLGYILYVAGSDSSFSLNNSMTMKDILIHIFKFYFDILIITYVFICLQIAGYLELRHKQDFLTMSIIAILFTPFATLFVYRYEQEDE